MSVPQAYTEATLLRMLRAYAGLETGGQTMSAIALAEMIGMAGNTGPGLRRACIGRGWLEVVEPPRGSLPGRLRVTPAGQTVLDAGEVPTLPQPVPYARARALRVLRLVADAEAAGSTISGSEIGARLGYSEARGADLRAELLDRRWAKVDGWLGHVSALRLTALGRDALLDAPPSQQERQHTLRQRRCLGCGNDFPSEGAGNRICPSCKSTAAFQSSVTSHAVRVRR